MKYIKLKHNKKLGLRKKELNFEQIENIDEYIGKKGYTLITFREVKENCYREKELFNIDATRRISNIVNTSNYILYKIDEDSEMAPLIYWDLLHQLPIKTEIVCYSSSFKLYPSYIERDYFKNAFTLKNKTTLFKVYEKTSSLLVEKNKGLDDWSFCIPTGPGDATALNAIVKRILELNIPKKEILLCGKPGSNFKYINKVRIVGKDIPGPPIWITKKKNILVQEAQFNNICILHDRVFLPKNFYEIILDYGDYYPFVSFQSLYFSNRMNTNVSRYSDINQIVYLSELNNYSIFEDNNKTDYFNKKLFANIEKSNFIYQNPLTYNEKCYLTGSLYIVKKSLWNYCPQDENLYWADFEDVEQGIRSQRKGIPQRIISQGFTQSIFSRPILINNKGIHYETAIKKVSFISMFSIVSFFNKPTIKISKFDEKFKIDTFANKYIEDKSEYKKLTDTLDKIIFCLYNSTIPRTEEKILEYVDDLEKFLILDQISYSQKKYIKDIFLYQGTNSKKNLLNELPELKNQLRLNSFSKRSFNNIVVDYFPSKNFIVIAGSLWSALKLNSCNGDYCFNKNGFIGYVKDILNSTPFIDYTKN